MPRKVATPPTARRDREHFAGNRRGSRHRLVLPVTCAGSSGRYDARILELSRTGAVVEMRDPGFLPADQRSSLLAFSARVADECACGMRIAVSEPKLSLAARVIRTMQHPATAALLMGIEFVAPLTPAQCRMLGLPTEESPRV